MKHSGLAVIALVALSAVPVEGQPAASPAPCPAVLPAHIRVMNCRLAMTLASGLERSATLRRLVSGIATLNGIVYVVFEPAQPGRKTPLLGSLSHQVGFSGPIAVLRITVLRDTGDGAIATLAHELRHATEVLEDGEARNEDAVDALFARIGTKVQRGVSEAKAALDTERIVFSELREARRRTTNARAEAARLVKDESP